MAVDQTTRGRIESLVLELASELETRDSGEPRERIRSLLSQLESAIADIAEHDADSERTRYHDLFRLAPDAYVVTNDAGSIVEANASFERLSGSSGRPLPGVPLAEFVEPEGRAGFRSTLGLLGAGAAVAEFEFRLLRGGGHPIHVAATAAAVPGPARDELEIRWLLRDVSERKRVETQLRALNAVLEERVAARTNELEAERNRLYRILERLEEGVIAIDRDLRVEFANAAAGALVLPEALTSDARLPDPWPHVSLRALAGRLFEPGADAVEERVESGDATFSVYGSPAGSSDIAVLVVADVSERERRERAQREFVTNAAHELQTPLAAIVSAVEVLQSGAKDVPEDRDHFLAHIEGSADRLGRLTRSLLVLARAQLGEERPLRQPVPLQPLLDQVVGGLEHDEDVEIVIACEPGLEALVNRDLAEQALANLADNAAKYTLSGRITIAARPLDDASVAIEVNDTGPGIPADRLARIFDRFYRGDDGTVAGFGIGLAIVSQAVRALGGEVEIRSGPEGGTSALVTLPRAGGTAE